MMTKSSPGKIKRHLVVLLPFLFFASSVVALPAGYASSNASYPVLYLLDGEQNIWHVAGSVEVLTRTGAMPPVIIVGVKSGNRMRDFNPHPLRMCPIVEEAGSSSIS
jgi:enterochelin esterase-like enzyme